MDNAEHSYISNGKLIIKAKDAPGSPEGKNYTSARLKTETKFDQKYGKFCARIKLPMGKRVWPAFWMLRHDNDWPFTGEIDIMEAVHPPANKDYKTKIEGTLHYGSQWPRNSSKGAQTTTLNNASHNFNVYCIEWEEGEIRWFVNDKHYSTQRKWYYQKPGEEIIGGKPGPFNDNFYLILNVAAGGSWPDSPNTPPQDPNEKLIPEDGSTQMEVDWVRVYKCAANPTTGIGCSTVRDDNNLVFGCTDPKQANNPSPEDAINCTSWGLHDKTDFKYADVLSENMSSETILTDGLDLSRYKALTYQEPDATITSKFVDETGRGPVWDVEKTGLGAANAYIQVKDEDKALHLGRLLVDDVKDFYLEFDMKVISSSSTNPEFYVKIDSGWPNLIEHAIDDIGPLNQWKTHRLLLKSFEGNKLESGILIDHSVRNPFVIEPRKPEAWNVRIDNIKITE